MKPIKVLHILEGDKEAHYFNNLVDHIAPADIEFSFVTFAAEGEFAESMRKRKLGVHSLGPLSKSNILGSAKKLWTVVNALEPDIVHTHLIGATFVGLIIGKAQRRRTIFTRHHSDAIHILSNPFKRQFYKGLEKLNNRNADHIIAPSQMVRKCLVDWEGTPRSKVSLIPYGQTSERFDAITPEVVLSKREELGMNGALSLVCVSRLFKGKGHRYLFEALAPMFRDGLNARLYLVGSGDYRGELEKVANNLGIADKVEFLGWRGDGLSIIGAADIIVHPSLEDALSQSLIESLMLAKPIVATDISGASDTLDGGKYGRLVPPADSNSFRIALQETIDNKVEAVDRARRGREYLLEYMNAKRTANEHVKIYQALVQS